MLRLVAIPTVAPLLIAIGCASVVPAQGLHLDFDRVELDRQRNEQSIHCMLRAAEMTRQLLMCR